jgi:pimeloyl-ACP methyl ester carboxylesterase
MNTQNRFHERLAHADGSEVHCYVQVAVSEESPLAIFSHGFNVPGTESGRLFIDLAQCLNDRGVTTVLFDYRGSGYSSWDFSEMTMLSEVEDLTLVLEKYRTSLRPRRTLVWGVSFGCAVAAHTLAARPLSDLAVFWSLSADVHRRYEERLGPELQSAGEVLIPAGFRVKRAFLDSLVGIDTYVDIREFGKPTLLVHGTEDTVAPIRLSRAAHAEAPASTEIVEVDGGVHGFKNQPQQRARAVESSLAWLASHSFF